MPIKPFFGFLNFLTQNYRTVELAEAVRLLESGQSLADDVFSLTFDDCYKGWTRHVLPECKRRQVPYSTFVTTGPLDSGKPLLYDTLMFLAENTWRKVADLSPWQSGVFLLDNADDIFRFVEEVQNFWRGRSKEDRTQFLEALSEYLGVSLNSDKFRNILLDWNDVQKMSMSGVTIGAHSVSHGCLSDLSKDECSWEISESKRRLEERLAGHSIDFFAYPYGLFKRNDCDTREIVKESGFRNAFTLDAGNSGRVEPFEIKRHCVSRGMLLDPHGKFNEPLAATELCGLGDIIFGKVSKRRMHLGVRIYQ
jgi:peptidoglycan/xylan/chitin deacetylase (PgdA/CDA1 family)